MRHPIFILAFFFLCCTTVIRGQQIRISGVVYNGLLQESLPGAVVRINAPDGRMLGTDTTRYVFHETEIDGNTTGYRDKHSGAAFSVIVAGRDSLWLTVEAKGFITYRQKIAARLPAGRKLLDAGAIHLMPQARDRRLDEAVVTASRVKMYYKGDTIVYNADAFNVAQTESLRKLLEQLPGAKLENGRITINGKLVEDLLICGKNFYGENIQAALDNLPAYVVDKVKAYDKDGELTELTGRDMHDRRYVLDVHIKREYLGTWMGTLIADGATEKLYGGAAFLARMDDRQMFSFYTDLNNYNQERELSDICTTTTEMPEGRHRTKGARADYYMEPNRNWRFTANASVRRSDADKELRTNTETFLSPANQMTRTEQHEDNRFLNASASASLRYRRLKHSQHELTYLFGFKETNQQTDGITLAYFLPGRESWDGLTLDAILRQEEALGEDNALLYSLLNPMKNHVIERSHRPMLTSVFTLGTDVLNFNTEMKRSVIAGSLFDNYRLTYYQQADKDWRRQYRYDRDSRTEVKSRLEYIRKYEKIGQTDGLLKPYLAFDHLYGTGNHPQYRLDRLAEWSDLLDWETGSMGMLPPVAWKSVCLDMLNSYYSQQKENSGEAGMKWSHKIKLPGSTTIQIEAGEALQYTRKVLDYQRESRYYRVVRDGIFARHQASVRWKKENRDGRNWLPEVQLRYQGTPSMPSLTQYLPIRDESDPLNLFIGNAELKDRFLHEVGHTFNLQQTKKHYAFNTEMVYRRVHNDIATRSLYDERTGVRTYCPVNTSRTHGLRGRASFSTPLDKKRRVYLSAAFEADYRQCENLSFLLQETDVASGLLRNMAYRPQLSLRATIGSVVRANASWYTTFSRLSQPGTENRYRQTNLFLNATGKLPWDLRLGTTLRSYIYAGNSQSTLNGPLTLWDATLSKEFKGLAITLKVHDILARSHSFTTTTDSFQRTERSADILPRYAMLTLTYNFNWTEKRK